MRPALETTEAGQGLSSLTKPGAWQVGGNCQLPVIARIVLISSASPACPAQSLHPGLPAFTSAPTHHGQQKAPLNT